MMGMTCTNDCKNCMYSAVEIRYVCTKPNSTCANNCSQCQFCKLVPLRYICRPYPGFGGTMGGNYR